MAPLRTGPALRTLSRLWLASPSPRSSTLPARAVGRFYSTAADEDVPPPPYLQKLKADLKVAMRAKDAPRLAVLRGILSSTLNASKTATPIRTDPQLVALIRKSQRASADAAAEFRSADRQDLAAKEEEQIQIMEEYIAGSGVQTLGEAELKALIQEAADKVKAEGVVAKSLVGEVMKRLKETLEGKDVDMKRLAKLVKEITG